MWYDRATVEFGFGMHYTNFSITTEEVKTKGNSSASTRSWDISSLISSCSETYMDLCFFASVLVSVKNMGKTASDFVTLGFIAGDYGPEPHPRKQLVAYERLSNISAGAVATATLNLTLGSLGRHDEAGNLVLYPGSYGLLVDVPVAATWNFTLTGTEAVLDRWPQTRS